MCSTLFPKYSLSCHMEQGVACVLMYVERLSAGNVSQFDSAVTTMQVLLHQRPRRRAVAFVVYREQVFIFSLWCVYTSFRSFSALRQSMSRQFWAEYILISRLCHTFTLIVWLLLCTEQSWITNHTETLKWNETFLFTAITHRQRLPDRGPSPD